jgi:hypothetical protein
MLKPITLAELKIREGIKKPNILGWVKYTYVEINGFEIGFIKDFSIDGGKKVLTRTYAEAGGFVEGYNLKWMLEQKNYKLR